jgi:hypothetical protein
MSKIQLDKVRCIFFTLKFLKSVSLNYLMFPIMTGYNKIEIGYIALNSETPAFPHRILKSKEFLN